MDSKVQDLKNTLLDAIPFASSNATNNAKYKKVRESIRAAQTIDEIKKVAATPGEDLQLRQSGAYLSTTSSDGLAYLLENKKSPLGKATPGHFTEKETDSISARLENLAFRFGMKEIVIQGDQLKHLNGEKPVDVINQKLAEVEKTLSRIAKELNVSEDKVGLRQNLVLQIGNPRVLVGMPANTEAVHMVNPDESSTIVSTFGNFNHFAHEFGHALDHVAAAKAKDKLSGFGRTIQKGREAAAANLTLNNGNFLAAASEAVRAIDSSAPDYASLGNDGVPVGDTAADAIRKIAFSAGRSGYNKEALKCDMDWENKKPYFSDPAEKFARIFETGIVGAASKCSPTAETVMVRAEARKAVLDIAAWKKRNSPDTPN